MHRPKWFKDGKVVISSAPTCGINKDGEDLFVVDPATGSRSDVVDDRLLEDVRAIRAGKPSSTVRTVDSSVLRDSGIAVPSYYDPRYETMFKEYVSSNLSDFGMARVGDLVGDKILAVRPGHGSPSQDQRTGDIPYIKVSDLRAGLVNINPTNMVPLGLAERYWKGPTSGIRAFDVITPARASKNIGDFCVVMPAQKRMVLTREVLVFRPGPDADFDSFYVFWAFSLKVVRDQWNRVVLMQTNREDVGTRYEELLIPTPPSRARADEVSAPFRDYFTGIAAARVALAEALSTEDHHLHLGVMDADPTTH